MSNNCIKRSEYRYFVKFWLHGEKECYGDSKEPLTEEKAEGFAWGVIREYLRINGIPLEGVAKKVQVFDSEGNIIWKCDSDMNIPSTKEIIENEKD